MNKSDEKQLKLWYKKFGRDINHKKFGRDMNINVDVYDERQPINRINTERIKMITIYFIRCNQFVKIGKTYAKTPTARLNQMQTGNRYELDCMGYIPFLKPDKEKYLHDKFADIQCRNEWFIAIPGHEFWKWFKRAKSLGLIRDYVKGYTP